MLTCLLDGEERGGGWGQLYPLHRSDAGSGAGYVDTSAARGLGVVAKRTANARVPKKQLPSSRRTVLDTWYLSSYDSTARWLLSMIMSLRFRFLLLKPGFKIACFRDRAKPI